MISRRGRGNTMPLTLLIPGEELPELTNTVDSRVQKQFGLAITTQRAVEVGAAGRGAARQVEVTGAEPGNLVELESGDGTRLWMRVESLGTQVAAMDRSRVDADTIRVPLTLGAASSRGAGDWVLKGLKLLGIDPAGDLADLGADLVARHFEDRLDPGPGLYPIRPNGALGERVRTPLPAGDAPLLVFLHGTFSSVGATFGALFRSPEWRSLVDAYGERIYGLNHRTVSESPAQNALALAEFLPPRARLHLVSHSRGGLVGELLARGPLSPDTLLPFGMAGRPADELPTLRRLGERLGELQPRIERFVRVACPARGTILASDRIDRYLSVLLNLISLIPAVDDTLIFPFAKATILSLIHKKAEPQALPGLEAMMPGSPYVRLLNLGGATSEADLAVIAGDVEGQGIMGNLGILATDLFYRQDHDLVVNTDSMFKGVERAAGVYYSYEKGSAVTHFNYFVNDSSRQHMTAWLLRRDAIPAGFRKLQGSPCPICGGPRCGRRGSMRPWSSCCPPYRGRTSASGVRGSGSIWLRSPTASWRSWPSTGRAAKSPRKTSWPKGTPNWWAIWPIASRSSPFPMTGAGPSSRRVNGWQSNSTSSCASTNAQSTCWPTAVEGWWRAR